MRKALLCLMAVLFVLLPGPSAEAASDPCDPITNYANGYHLGLSNFANRSTGTNGGTGGTQAYTRPPQDIIGSWAQINTPPPPPVCSGDRDGVSVWSMLGSEGTVKGWAQSGYMVWWGSGGWRYWSQYSPDSRGWKSTWLAWGPAPGQTHAYFQYFDPTYTGPWGTGSESIIIDNTFVDRTNFNPRVVWGAPNAYMASEFSSENYHLRSDMPGTPSYHTTFRSMQYQSLSRGWLPTPCNAWFGVNTWNGSRAATAYWNVKTGTKSLGVGTYDTCQSSDTWVLYP